MASQIFFAVVAAHISSSLGDIGAAARHRGLAESPRGLAEAPEPEASRGSLVVPLKKVDALHPAGQSQSHHSHHTRDSFYVGEIAVGHPHQTMQVLFDTASGHVLLPHRACKSTACQEHRRYSPWESSTATDVNADGHEVQHGLRIAHGVVNRTEVTVEFTQADLGSGLARGVLVRDDVCLVGTAACASLAVLAALHLDDEPFRAMPHDGILGLALEGLSAGALSTFYERLMDGPQKLLPHFGLYLGTTGGEISFGGHDHARLASPIRWLPVEKPEEGFWQVQIREVRVGNVTVDRCLDGCRGILDSGSSSLGMQAPALQKLRPRLHTRIAQGGSAMECEGPNLQLDLGEFVLELTAQDYTGVSCQPEIGLLDLDPRLFHGTYALGTAVLRHYYTAFDWALSRVGFAALTPTLGQTAASIHSISLQQETPVVV